jgi:hypothetical protein
VRNALRHNFSDRRAVAKNDVYVDVWTLSKNVFFGDVLSVREWLTLTLCTSFSFVFGFV